jgi:hypothetical protein
MNASRLVALSFTAAAIGALAIGCSGAPDGEHAAATSSSALTSLPSDANWATGFSYDSPQLGVDNDGTPLYACRALANGVLTPGKTRKDWNICDVGYGGGELSLSPYQTLVPTWSSDSYGQIPPGSFVFGQEPAGSLYPCRAIHPGSTYSLQAGKIRAGFAGCDYPYGGAENNAVSYTVLNYGGALPLIGVSVNGTSPMPLGAIPTGTDDNGATIYTCAASYSGTTQVGKAEVGWGACDIPWGGHEQSVAGPFNVLTVDLTAAPLNNNSHAYQAGTDGNGAALGICIAPYGATNAVQVGKYLANGACNFGYGGHEVSLGTNFQIVGTYAAPLPTQGQPCTSGCASGLVCAGSPKTCVPANGCGTQGLLCCGPAVGYQCQSGLSCQSNVCEKAAACVGTGASCTSASCCSPDSCVSGKCQAPSTQKTCSGQTATSSATNFVVGAKGSASLCAIGAEAFFANSLSEAETCAQRVFGSAGVTLVPNATPSSYDYQDWGPFNDSSVCTIVSVNAFSQSDADTCVQVDYQNTYLYPGSECPAVARHL